ncbi:M24 family metallopeptidase [bacterium]|nr:M24 family metallopeptidase [bacterium]
MNRLERLKAFLSEQNYEAIILCKPSNIAAFFKGAQISLGFRQEPAGRAAICITRDATILIANTTEATRIAEDELSWVQGLNVFPFRWDHWNLKNSVSEYLYSSGLAMVCDDVGIYGVNVGAALEGMYYPLYSEELDSIKELANVSASVVESVAKNISPGMTEAQVAGKISGQLIASSISPELVLVAADERISKFRHCIPKHAEIRQLALLSVTVHRRGLFVSLSRLVSHGAVNSEWRQLQETCCRVDARAIYLSTPGASVGEIFESIKGSYNNEGHPNEWHAHHQGGPAGFSGRDYKAMENEKRCLVKNQPVVWNPTIQGTKSEDTILTTQPDKQPDILTDTGNWEYYYAPIGSGSVIRRPAILVK